MYKCGYGYGCLSTWAASLALLLTFRAPEQLDQLGGRVLRQQLVERIANHGAPRYVHVVD